MFRRHRDDLIDAQEKTIAALNQVITVLADQVEWLRWQLNQTPHMSPALRSVGTPSWETRLPEAAGGPPEENFNPHMSEEEEEILALHLNDYLSDQDVKDLGAELGKVIPLPPLEADE